MPEKFTALLKSVGDIIAWILMALLCWNWLTVNQQEKTLVEHSIRLEVLEKKTDEIVPRSENERRYQSIETGVSQNFQSISTLNKSCYEALAAKQKP